MKRNYLDFLGVKQDEQLPVLLMLGTGFFIGIFIATYQVTAESLFLNKLSDQLDRAFLVSGVLGIITTAGFSFLQNRIRFIGLTIISMLIIVISTISLYYFYHSGVEEIQNRTLFLMYCLIGPITAVLLLCYWGIFGRLFNFKQSKRIIGWIDTGQLIAIIGANFLIPITTPLIADTSDYMWVCNASMLGALACLIIIYFKFNLARLHVDVTVRQETKFTKIFKDKYVVLLSFFLVISMTTFIFNQFTFQTLLNKQYPDQRDLTNFLAYFNGAIYALSLFMQLFVNDKLISTYGIKVSLFILPGTITITILASIMAGGFLGFSPDQSQTFIYFALFVTLTRLFNSTLRDSLESPVYKLLFIPLDNRYRFGIQSKVEGVVNEAGRLLGGVIIFLLTLIPIFNLLWMPVLVIALIVLYFIVTNNLYSEYKNKVRAKLESSGYQQDILEVGFARVISKLEMNLLAAKSSTAVFSFKLLEKLSHNQIGSWINTLMKSNDEKVREYAQERMNEIKGLSVSENYVIRLNGSKTNGKNVLTKADLELLLSSGGDIQKTRIQKLTRSQNSKDRHYAAELLLHSNSADNFSFLIELLNDADQQVRLVAIKTAAQKFNNEVIVSLIENLGNPNYSNAALNALIQIGQPAIQLLDNAFYRSGQSSQIMVRIVQIIGAIGGSRAKEMLWNKIDYPDKVVVSQVLLALGQSGFKAGIMQVSRIKNAIESDIADIAWNIAAYEEIGSHPASVIIKRALNREVQNDIEHIYMLLAMLYDTRSIQLVKESIESGTADGVTYAIELLDVFLSEQLKQRVIPVLDDISNNEKLNRLEIFYPRVSLGEKLVLKFLINRDFTQSNRWTKACVLHQIGIQRINDFTLDLIAQLYNPDKLIRETAAWALHEIDPELYQSNTIRLGDGMKKSLDESVLRTKEQFRVLLYDVILFLQRIPLFEDVAGITLSYVADLAIPVYLKEGEELMLESLSIDYFYILYRGAAQFYESGRYTGDLDEGYFIGEQLIGKSELFTNTIKAKEPSVFLKFNKDEFYELLSDQVKLADKILDYISV